MDDVTIDLSPLNNLFDLNRIKEIMRPEIEKAMQLARGEIIKRMPDGATGNMRRAPLATAIITAEGIEGKVFIQESNPAFSYMKYVEFGRSPGKMSPWDVGTSLFLWTKRKITSALFKAKDAQARTSHQRTGKRVGKSKGRDAQILTTAFLIARAIGKRGTKAQHPFALGWEAATPKVQVLMEYAYEKAMIDITK